MISIYIYKVKQSVFSPWGLQEVEAPRFHNIWHIKAVRLSALRTGRLYSPGNFPGTHFCYRLSWPQGRSKAGRIMSIKNSNDIIRNRTRDLPSCTAVPEPTAPPRVPFIYMLYVLMHNRYDYIPRYGVICEHHKKLAHINATGCLVSVHIGNVIKICRI